MVKVAIAALLLLAGCPEHGSRPDGATGSELETARFVPQLCTGGQPGDPTCPVNVVVLDFSGVSARLGFVMQALGSGLFMTNVQLEAGLAGFAVRNLMVRMWTNPAMSMDFILLTDLSLSPGQTVGLGAFSITTGNPTSQISIAATFAGPFQPPPPPVLVDAATPSD